MKIFNFFSGEEGSLHFNKPPPSRIFVPSFVFVFIFFFKKIYNFLLVMEGILM